MAEIPAWLARRLERSTIFQSLPPNALRIVELISGPDTDLDSVARVIGADPLVAAQIMGIANSALYARRRESKNLRQALIVLGLNAALNLSLSFTLTNALGAADDTGEDEFDVTAFWRRAIVAATWGKLLASEVGRRDAEAVFLAALLQDIGMLAIQAAKPEVYEGIAPFRLEHASLTQHEKTRLETDHRAVGAWLLEQWGMPGRLVDTIRHSHDMAAIGLAPPFREFVRAVAMSGELSPIWGPANLAEGIQRAGLSTHRYLGILPARLVQLFETVETQIPVLDDLLEMQLFATDTLAAVTESARETLVTRNQLPLNDMTEFAKLRSRTDEKRLQLRPLRDRDGIMGLCHRRQFETVLEKEFASARTNDWPLSVALIDIDGFSQINGLHGVRVGDAVLRDVADLLRTDLRGGDLVGRFGDDVFAMLLPGIDLEAAEGVANRIVEQARQRRVKAGPSAQAVSITLSVGAATMDAGRTWQTAKALLAAAQEALEQSKRSGRDRHTCYQRGEAA